MVLLHSSRKQIAPFLSHFTESTLQAMPLSSGWNYDAKRVGQAASRGEGGGLSNSLAYGLLTLNTGALCTTARPPCGSGRPRGLAGAGRLRLGAVPRRLRVPPLPRPVRGRAAVWAADHDFFCLHRSATQSAPQSAPGSAPQPAPGVADLAFSVLSTYSTMSLYIAEPAAECGGPMPVAVCLRTVYLPANHLAYLAKWSASTYPPGIVFFPDALRSAVYACLTLRAAHRGGELTPRLAAAVAAEAAAHHCLVLLVVCMAARARNPNSAEWREFGHGTVLPASMDTCPRWLRPRRSALLRAVQSVLLRLEALAGGPLPELTQARKAP